MGLVRHTGGRAGGCFVVGGVTRVWVAEVKHIAQRSASEARWE